jgi:hypothetical protein
MNSNVATAAPLEKRSAIPQSKARVRPDRYEHRQRASEGCSPDRTWLARGDRAEPRRGAGYCPTNMKPGNAAATSVAAREVLVSLVRRHVGGVAARDLIDGSRAGQAVGLKEIILHIE